MSKRVALWDNLKLFLIFLVVLGHLTLQYFYKSEMFTIMTMVIYSFHMPAFVFVSGLFSKHSINKDKPPLMKAFAFLMLCYFVRVLTYASNIVFGVRSSFDILSIKDIPWYMMAMAIWYMLTWAVRKIDTKYILITSITFACFAGYMSGNTDFLCSLRVVTFFPFFYCGYALDADRLDEMTSKKGVKIFSAVYFTGFVALIVLLGEKVNWLFPLLSGRRTFFALKPYGDWGCLIRLAYFVVVSLLIISIISLCPRRELKISRGGQRTLQIYCLHRPILYIMKNAGLFYLIRQVGSGWEWLAILLMVGLTALLSLNVFSKPINYLLKPRERFYDTATK